MARYIKVIDAAKLWGIPYRKLLKVAPTLPGAVRLAGTVFLPPEKPEVLQEVECPTCRAKNWKMVIRDAEHPTRPSSPYCSPACSKKANLPVEREAEVVEFYMQTKVIGRTATQFNISQRRVHDILDRNAPGVIEGNRKSGVCPVCKKEFKMWGGTDRIYCSNDCKVEGASDKFRSNMPIICVACRTPKPRAAFYNKGRICKECHEKAKAATA